MSGRWRPLPHAEGLLLAMNAHNLDAMVACFAGGRDDDDPKGLRVAEFAAAVGVGADTIRFYEDRSAVGASSDSGGLPGLCGVRCGSAVAHVDDFAIQVQATPACLTAAPLRRKSCIGGPDLGVFPTEPGGGRGSLRSSGRMFGRSTPDCVV
jgi:hypothetical protein